MGLCKRMPGDLDEKLMLIIEALSGGAPRVAVATLRDLLSVEANEFVELAELTEEVSGQQLSCVTSSRGLTPWCCLSTCIGAADCDGLGRGCVWDHYS